MHKKPQTLDELKAVLATINTCRTESMVIELRYSDLEERYRTRLLYAAQPEEVEQCSSEFKDACTIRNAWQELVDEADRVDYSLEETKLLFSEETRKQVSDFLAYSEEMFDRLKNHGPGLPTVELSSGLDLLRDFQVSASPLCLTGVTASHTFSCTRISVSLRLLARLESSWSLLRSSLTWRSRATPSRGSPSVLHLALERA